MAEFGRQLADLVMMPQSPEPAPAAPALPPGTPEMKPYDPTMRERMSGALQTGMEKLGMDRYRARQVAQSLAGGQSSALPLQMGIADIVPGLGTALQTQEAVRGGEAAIQSAKEGDLIGAGVEAVFAGMGMIPGAVATKKAIQQSRKMADRTIPVPMREPQGVTYATSQEGPFYRVRPNVTEAAPRQGRGTKESVGPAPTVGGSARGDVPQPITDEAVQQVIQQPDNFVRRIADEYSLTNTGSPYELPEIPQSSLLKQAPIGRVFGLAATDDPTYKRVVFDSYARQYPQLLEQSGAQNYDQLLEAAYRQLAQETEQQFRKLPINMSYHRAGEGNYENSKELLRDIYGNRHMYVFQGGDPHDFLNKVDPATGLNTNEMFRAVHDFFGHAIHGNQFGPKGEEIAWAAHSKMFSPLARLAMTAETRGQNSFVNYTPINAELKAEIARLNGEAYEASRRGNTKMLDEINKDLKEAWSSFQFAPQKSVILPPEFLDLNYAGGMPRAIQPLVRPQAGTTTGAQLTHFSQQPGLTMTDPTMYGTGIKGEELARLQGEPGAVMERSYFYAGDPSTIRPEPGLGPYRYGAQSSELYDIAADPLQLGTLARESQRIPYTSPYNKGLLAGDPATDLERLVKEYGYEGLINPNLSQPTAIMFKPKEVRPFKKGGKVSEEQEESRPPMPHPEVLKYMSLDDLVNPEFNFPRRYPGQTTALPSDLASESNKEVQDRRLKQGAVDAVDWAVKNLPQPVNPVMQSLRNILEARKRRHGDFALPPDIQEASGIVILPEELIPIGGNKPHVPRFKSGGKVTFTDSIDAMRLQLARGGGIKEKAKSAIKEAAKSAGMKEPVVAEKNLTTLQDTHTTLSDQIRERVAEANKMMEGFDYKYDKGQRIFTKDSAAKNKPPYTIIDRTRVGNQVMTEDGTPFGKKIIDPTTGRAKRTPYEPGYRVRYEQGDDWSEFTIPASAVLGDVEMAGGGAIRDVLKEKLKSALGVAVKTEVPEQKMLQGFYRGYAGDYDATKAAAQDAGVYVSPQRRVGEFYSEKRAAQTGQDPHVEMILADPFSGREYGHATSGTGRNPPIMTRARELAPEDVKGRTQLKKSGGYVSPDPVGNDLRSILGLKVGGDAAKAKVKEKLKEAFTPKQVEKAAEKMADRIKKDNPKLTDEQVMAKAKKDAEKKLQWEKVEKPELEKKFGPLQKAPYSAPLSARQKNVPEVVEKRIEETKRFLEQPTEPWTPPPKELQAFDRALIKDAMEGFPGVEQTRFPRYVPPRSDLSYIEEIYGDPVNRALIEGQIKRGLPLGGETFYASLYPLKVAALERGIPEERFNQFIYSIAPASARNSIFNEMAVGQFLRDMHARGLPLDEATVDLERAKFKEKFGVGLPLMPVHREGVASVLQGPQDLRELLKADIPTNYKIPTYGTQKAGDFGQSMVLDVHEAAGQTRGSPYHPYFTEQGGFGSTEYGAAESQMLDIAQDLGLPGGTAQAGRWFGGGELTGLKSPRGDALDLLERQTAYTLYHQGIAPTPRNIRNSLLDMIETGEGLFMPYFKKESMPDLRTVKKKGGAVKKRKVKITDSKDAQMLALLKKG